MTGASFLLVLGSLLAAQRGDKPGEAQPELPSSIKIPPAPVIPPERALETLRLVPGFTLELIASEPLVVDPIQIAFDAAGRLWVLELQGYMPDVTGRGEDRPICKLVVLQDKDCDGMMETRTVFLDRLVMPRAIAPAWGGMLVAEPPNLWFCRDTDGDLKCDKKELVDPGYAAGKGNPEHLPNGLLWALDNWIYNAKSRARYRRIDGEWVRAQTLFRGQWGITQDDWGRLFYNTNFELLRGDFAPVYDPEAHAQKSDRTNLRMMGRVRGSSLKVTAPPGDARPRVAGQSTHSSNRGQL